MNWTEGNLVRHSRGRTKNNKIVEQQKQYFARRRMLAGSARNTARNATVLRIGGQVAGWGSSDYPDWFKASTEDRNGMPSTGIHHDVQLGDPRCTSERHYALQGTSPLHHRDHDKGIAVVPSAGEECHEDKRRRLLNQSDWAGLSMPRIQELVFRGNSRAEKDQLWSDAGSRAAKTHHNHHANSPHRRGQPFDHPVQARHHGVAGGPGTASIKIQIGTQGTRTNVSVGSHTRDEASTQSFPDCAINNCPSSRNWELSSSDCEQGEKAGSGRQRSRRRRHERRPEEDSSSSNQLYVSKSVPTIQGPIPQRVATKLLSWSNQASESGLSMEVETSNILEATTSDMMDHDNWKSLMNLSPSDLEQSVETSSSSVNQLYQPEASESEVATDLNPGLFLPPNSSAVAELSSNPPVRSNHFLGPPQTTISRRLATTQSREGQESIANFRTTSRFPHHHRRVHIGAHDKELSNQNRSEGHFRAQPPSKPAREERAIVQEQANRNKSSMASTQFMSNSLPKERVRQATRLPERLETRNQADKDNNLWMKFVLDDPEDDIINAAFRTAAHDAARSLRPSISGTSDLGNSQEYRRELNGLIPDAQRAHVAQVDLISSDALSLAAQLGTSIESQQTDSSLVGALASFDSLEDFSLPSELDSSDLARAPAPAESSAEASLPSDLDFDNLRMDFILDSSPVLRAAELLSATTSQALDNSHTHVGANPAISVQRATQSQDEPSILAESFLGLSGSSPASTGFTDAAPPIVSESSYRTFYNALRVTDESPNIHQGRIRSPRFDARKPVIGASGSLKGSAEFSFSSEEGLRNPREAALFDGQSQCGGEGDFREMNIQELEDASVVAVASPIIKKGPERAFRFAAPRSFVGRRAEPNLQDDAISVSEKPAGRKGRKRSRKRGKRAKDGRPDIRGLPDFDGDDIEDSD